MLSNVLRNYFAHNGNWVLKLKMRNKIISNTSHRPLVVMDFLFAGAPPMLWLQQLMLTALMKHCTHKAHGGGRDCNNICRFVRSAKQQFRQCHSQKCANCTFERCTVVLHYLLNSQALQLLFMPSFDWLNGYIATTLRMELIKPAFNFQSTLNNKTYNILSSHLCTYSVCVLSLCLLFNYRALH